MRIIRSICVFCGAGAGVRPEYVQMAEATAAELARRRIELVYGGGTVGLMGAMAHHMQQQGGRVTGIIPSSLQAHELADRSIDQLIVVESMAERKDLMFKRSDAFITLPGGFGTLDELFEAITFGQLGIHNKPVGLLNTYGYFDALLAWVDHAVAEEFVRPHHRQLIVYDTDPVRLIEKLEAYQAPQSLITWDVNSKR